MSKVVTVEEISSGVVCRWVVAWERGPLNCGEDDADALAGAYDLKCSRLAVLML